MQMPPEACAVSTTPAVTIGRSRIGGLPLANSAARLRHQQLRKHTAPAGAAALFERIAVGDRSMVAADGGDSAEAVGAPFLVESPAASSAALVGRPRWRRSSRTFPSVVWRTSPTLRPRNVEA